MNKDVFKQYLVHDKAFLRELYQGQSQLQNNRILTSASDTKLNTLIRLLHFIANGEIKIKKANFDVIEENRKLGFIKRNVEKSSTCKTFKK